MGTRKNGAREGDTSDAVSNTNKDLVGARDRGVATRMLLPIRVREKCRILLR